MSPATRRAACWAAGAAATVVLIGACGGGGDGDDAARTTPAPPPTGSTAPATAVSSPPPAPRSPTPTGTAPEDPAGAERDVRAAWAALFDPESSVDDRSTVVEDGPENALMIENLFADRLGSRLRATVTSVAFTTSEDATVGYALTRDGGPLDPGGPGAAVRQDGTWKVALRTVCELTRHAEDAPRAPSCDASGEPSATAGVPSPSATAGTRP
ncbi:hypothetical protein AB0E25_29340 [Streptomyces bobili]|uniref:hypothetical protein n=1 Tax=Streptomyces bobili TaxID=67280 RepID=UPI0034038934